MKSILLATALAGALAAALAGQAAAHGHHRGWQNNVPDRCLEVGRIYSWQANRNHRSLVMESDSLHKYRVDLMGYCPGLDFAQTLAIRAPGGTELSCVSAGDTIAYRDAGMVQRCFIKHVAPVRAVYRDHRRSR